MIYEVRTYTLRPGTVAEFEERYEKRLPSRARNSKLGGFWHTHLGGLNRFPHIWCYKDLNERARVREESRRPGGAWPPQAGVRPVRQENKLLIPASFSPVR